MAVKKATATKAKTATAKGGGRKSAKKATEYAKYVQGKVLAIKDAADLRDALKVLGDDDLKRHAKKVGADVSRAFALKHHGLQRMNAINVIVFHQMNR